MRAPPPVRVQVGLERHWLIALALVSAAAAANTTAWGLARLEIPVATTTAVAIVAAVFAAAACAAAVWRTAPRGQLLWDGHSWVWQPVDTVPVGGEVTVALDLDSWMLLRFDAVTRSRLWLPISLRSASAVWSPLRGALYAPRPADVPAAAARAGSPR